MSGGYALYPECFGLVDQLFKFQFLVAHRAGNRRSRLHVLRDKIVHHLFLKLFFHVQDVIGDADPLGHPPGIGQIVQRTAGAEPVVRVRIVPQLQGNPHSIEPTFLHDPGGDRAVYPAAHGYNNLFFLFFNRHISKGVFKIKKQKAGIA